MNEIKMVKPIITEYSDELEALENIEEYSHKINELYADNENGNFDFDTMNELEYYEEELSTAMKAYMELRESRYGGKQ